MPTLYHIYFAREHGRREHERVKVGITSYDLTTRLGSLRGPRGHRTQIIYAIPVFTREAEQIFHWMLRVYRVEGEWFFPPYNALEKVIVRWLKNQNVASEDTASLDWQAIANTT